MGCDEKSLLKGCGSTLIGSGNDIRPVYPDDAVSELDLWDSVAQEPAILSGTPFRLWSVRRAKNMHPLYREPSAGGLEWEFHGPWEMYGALEFDQGNEIEPDVSAEGLRSTATARLYLSRKSVEDVSAPEPKIGDVVDMWERKPFESMFQYWDITKANPDGNLWTSNTFTQYRIELKSRTRFEPGRKTEGTKI